MKTYTYRVTTVIDGQEPLFCSCEARNKTEALAKVKKYIKDSMVPYYDLLKEYTILDHPILFSVEDHD